MSRPTKKNHLYLEVYPPLLHTIWMGVPCMIFLCRPGYHMQFLENILVLDPYPPGMDGWEYDFFHIYGHFILIPTRERTWDSG